MNLEEHMNKVIFCFKKYGRDDLYLSLNMTNLILNCMELVHTLGLLVSLKNYVATLIFFFKSIDCHFIGPLALYVATPFIFLLARFISMIE